MATTKQVRLLAFDPVLKRPACVILQAAMGTDFVRGLEDHFPSETWLLAPTEGMSVFPVTDKQLVMLEHMVSGQARKEAEQSLFKAGTVEYILRRTKEGLFG